MYREDIARIEAAIIARIEAATEEIETLGDLQIVFAVLKRTGWSRAGVEYVMNQVWWEK